MKVNLKNNLLKGEIHYLTSDYKTRNKTRKNHNGMDFVGANGRDDIVSFADGTVKYIGYDASGGGYYLSIKTEDYEHRYFHLDGNKIYVKQNAKIKKGETIASMGKSGNATNYCLHFAIYKNGQYLDPYPYLINSDSEYITFVKGIQKAFGAQIDGLVGPETLAKTQTISPVLNNTHPAVKVLQIYLTSLGYDLGKFGADGIYGEEMVKIIKDYQKRVVGLNGNLVDGILTSKRQTWQSLLKYQI